MINFPYIQGTGKKTDMKEKRNEKAQTKENKKHKNKNNRK